MKIRLAIPEDVPGILELLRQVGQVHYNGRPDIFRDNAQKYGPSQVLSMLGKRETPILVAYERKKVLGYCMMQIQAYYRDTVIRDHTTCYIDDLCVDENHHRQGIATALYRHVCDFAREQGCTFVTLNVWTGNDGAQRFYENMGMTSRSVTMEQKL